MYWFTIWFISPNFLGSDLPVFGLIGMTYTLAALHLAPLWRRRLSYASVVAWSLVNLPLWLWLARALAVPVWLRALAPQGDAAILLSIGLECVTAALLGTITRSWRVAGAIICLLVAAWFLDTAVLGGRTWVGWPWPAILYHAGVATVLFVWAVRTRGAGSLPPYACQACGYDLRGLADGPCPECGKQSSEGAVGAAPVAPAPT